MKAFILCGGMGTRLRAVIADTQKAVADVGGRPFLAYVIDELAKAGLRDLVFCTHYQSHQVSAALEALPADPARRIAIVREPEPMGTGGAVLHALAATGYGGPMICVNADTYLGMRAYGLAAQAQAPALVVTPVADSERYGAVEIDATQHVMRLTEKGVKGAGLISAGVYRFEAQALRSFGVAAASMEKDIIPHFVEQGTLRAVIYEGPFLDIGTPDSLQKIREQGVHELQ